MNIAFPENIFTKHLTIETLKVEHLNSLASQLYHESGFFELQRGLNSTQKIIDYFTNYLKDPARLCLLAKLTSSPETYVATSSFFDATTPLYRLEIGFTWIAPKWHKTFVNTELKFAMLSFAFETLQLKRIQFSVQPSNTNSIRAVKRLGASYEGTLRNWRYNAIGDSGERAIFSILDREWPNIKSQTFLNM